MDYLHSNNLYLNNLSIDHLLIDTELNIKLVNLTKISKDNNHIDQYYLGALLYYLITSEKLENIFNFYEEKDVKQENY